MDDPKRNLYASTTPDTPAGSDTSDTHPVAEHGHRENGNATTAANGTNHPSEDSSHIAETAAVLSGPGERAATVPVAAARSSLPVRAARGKSVVDTAPAPQEGIPATAPEPQPEQPPTVTAPIAAVEASTVPATAQPEGITAITAAPVEAQTEPGGVAPLDAPDEQVPAAGAVAVAAQDGATSVAAPERRERLSLFSIIAGTRWILAIPAVLISVYAAYNLEQMRTFAPGYTRPAVPPEQTWQAFLLSGLLLTLATWPKRRRAVDDTPEGGAPGGKRRRDIIGLGIFAVVLSGLLAGLVVYAAYKVRLATILLGLWILPNYGISPDSQPPLAWFAIAWGIFLAVVLFLMVMSWFWPGLRTAGPSNFVSNLMGMKRRYLFLVPLGAAIVCSAAAAPLFWKLNEQPNPAVAAQDWMVNNGSWLLYIASMLLYGLAFVVWENRTTPPAEGQEGSPRSDRLPWQVDWLIMLGLFGAALYLRVTDLGTIPPGIWFDEAQNGLVGEGLLAPNAAHVAFLGDFTQMGSLYFYLQGAVVHFLGNTVFALRIIPAVAGSLIVPMLYMIGSRLFGWRVGLAAGALLATQAWNITFSRFGIATLPTITLDVAIYLCMVQALRTGRLGYFAFAGVLTGLANHAYYAAKLIPLVLGAVLFQMIITQREKVIRSVRAGAVVFVIGAAIAFLPVGLYAYQQPQLYNARTDIVSIFSTQNSPNDAALKVNLDSNVKRHALMFNWEGDGNGRHNLNGSPNLDWITAALFFVGLASCLMRIWRWQYAFPLVWFLADMSGGVFSLPFEAPQSHRTLEDSIVVALLAGIVIGETWQLISGWAMVDRIAGAFDWLRKRRAFQPRRLAWPTRATWVISGLAVLAIAWGIGGLNLDKYFNVQAKDLSVWKDMNAPQGAAAQAVARYGNDYDIYVTAIFRDIPPSRYLAPGIQTNMWPGMQALPLAPGKPKGAVVILDLPSAADVARIARIYPDAEFEILTAPTNPEPLVYTIKIPYSDLQGGHGVHATMYDPNASTPKADKVVTDFNVNWKEQGLSAGTLRMASTLHVDQFGEYIFQVQSASPGGQGTGEVMVDGYTLTPGQALPLASGLHSVVATDTVASDAGTSQLLWGIVNSQPQPIPPQFLYDPQQLEPHGLTGLYRPGSTFDTQPAIARVDPVISFYNHETVLPRPYTVEWSGKLYIPEDGSYGFGTENLSTSRLNIDGKELINNPAINNLMENHLELTRGLHDVQIFYQDMGDASHMYLYWTPPGHGRSIIPSAFLWPTMGQYPNKPASGAWPTLEESDGSVLPPDRVVYEPPRPRENPGNVQVQPAPQPQQNPGQSSGPANDTNQPPVRGVILKTETILGDGRISGRPRAADADKAGNIYVFTEKDSKLHKFSPDGKEQKVWNVTEGDANPVPEGSAVLVKGDNVYVLNAATSNLIGFTLDGQPTNNIHLCICFYPRSVSLARDGNFWVSNTGTGVVLKVNDKGQTVATLGSQGSDPGQFREPAGVWEAKDGTIYVADVTNNRVQSFTPDLKPISQWNIGQSVARDGNRLTGDSDGNVLVTQYEGRNIVKYDKEGKELGRWAYRGNGTLGIPAGIAVTPDDKIVVLFPDLNQGIVFDPKKQ